MRISPALLLAFLATATTGAAAQPLSLRDLAGKSGVLIGAAAGYRQLTTDPQYAAVLARQYDLMTPENEMKWDQVNPSEGVYDWKKSDAMVAFARRHGMKVRGTNLVWHQSLPKWIDRGSFTRARMIDIMRSHITAEAGHFRGKIYCWDVVNEPFEGNGTLRRTPFERFIGSDYIELAFRAAHEADPRAKLILNEDSAQGREVKSDAVYNLVKSFKARGVPIDGVGFEMHLPVSGTDYAGMAWNIKRLRALGVEASVTELDVRLQKPVTSVKLAAQAVVYRRVCDTLLSGQPHAVLVTWGFTDKSSWIPGYFKGCDAGLPLDVNFKPKPAWFAIADALRAAARK